jgi:hypothetical protein
VEANFTPGAALKRKDAGVKTSIFSSTTQAKDYMAGKDIHPRFLLWNNDPYEQRKIADWRRFPILEEQTGLYKLGVMGEIRDETGTFLLSRDDDAKVRQQHGSNAQMRRNINILFVVDGTSSMGPYFRSSIGPAIRTVINRLNQMKTNNTLRFGCVVYRDAAEGKRVTETHSLTSNGPQIATWINSIEAIDYSDASKTEAMYYGLKAGLRSVLGSNNETNVVVLVGDAGNHGETPETMVGENEIIDLLVARKAFFVAFQVHNDDDPAYDLFKEQTMRVILKAGQEIQRQGEGLQNALGFNVGPVAFKSLGDGVYKLQNYAYFASCIYSGKGETKDPGDLKAEIVNAVASANAYTDTIIAAANLMIEDGQSYERVIEQIDYQAGTSRSKYVDAYAPGLIEYLRNMDIPEETMKRVCKEKLQMYSEGYAPISRDDLEDPLFTKVLLLDANEMGAIVQNLNRLQDAGNSNERRTRLYDTWIQILKEYLGDISERDLMELTLEEINKRVFGLPSPKSFINDIKLKDITDPSRMDEKSIRQYAFRIDAKAKRLTTIFNDKRNNRQFMTNNRRYYWIEEELIP